MIKIITGGKKNKFLGGLKRLRLYHPSLDKLRQLSKGDKSSVGSRAKQYSSLLEDIIINGVWKRTGPGRLNALDNWFISKLSLTGKDIALLDVGASDGSTTFDTVSQIKKRMDVHVDTTILELQFRIQEFKWGPFHYFLTAFNQPFLIQWGPVGFLFEETKASEGVIFNPVTRFFKKIFAKIQPEKWSSRKEDLLLINPLIAGDPSFHWLEQNLFELNPDLTERFDIVRCCNILNLEYFPQDQLIKGLRILSSYLKPGGYLLISRSIDKPEGVKETATLWQLRQDGLEYVDGLNGGSEVAPLMGVIQKQGGN